MAEAAVDWLRSRSSMVMVWLWLVEGQTPRRSDAIGATLAIIVALVISGFAARAR